MVNLPLVLSSKLCPAHERTVSVLQPRPREVVLVVREDVPASATELSVLSKVSREIIFH